MTRFSLKNQNVDPKTQILNFLNQNFVLQNQTFHKFWLFLTKKNCPNYNWRLNDGEKKQ